MHYGVNLSSAVNMANSIAWLHAVTFKDLASGTRYFE